LNYLLIGFNYNILNSFNKSYFFVEFNSPQYFLPYLLKATNPAERVGVLMGMRRSMSEVDFNGTLTLAKTSLIASDWQKLKQTLDILLQGH
jgi:hypothetical protein